MYKRITLIAIGLGLISVTACKHGEDKSDDGAPLAAGMIRLDLSKAGINATIDVPDTTKKVWGVVASSSGSINVFVGKGFNMLINVSGKALAMKKSDINGDDLNKPKTWVVNDSNNLLYSTQKDTNAFMNAKEEFHFYALVKKGTTTYYVQELEQGADGNVNVFGQADAQAMLTAAKTITPVTAAPKNPS